MICSISLFYLKPTVNWTGDLIEVITVARKEAIFVKHGAETLVKMPRNLLYGFALLAIRQGQAKDVAVFLGLRRLSKASQRCFVFTPMVVED